MGWLSSLTDLIGITNTKAARAQQARADEAARKAEEARKQAEAETARIEKQKAIYNQNLKDIASQQSTDLNTATLTNVVAGGTADVMAADALKKKKGIAPTLSSQLGINL